MINNRVIVTVKPKHGKSLPCDFPWINGVSLSLLGDITILANLQNELAAVKSLVNKDINRFKLKLSDFDIIIKNH